ncbi:HNH endonuclease [Fructilactobacillus lindneri]|uniref:Putative HNH nuclease YajD n=1 Tax=Fructilactobacillus lindneri TaxID=53444 RepID=A0AB33BR31_9LACO|nr:HNH endonuclease [Fructilactobacillus lindneri]ANZ59334.1 HNH endonuclease [Fructilactobacillus lindneri]
MPKVRRCRYELCNRLVPYPNHYCNEHKQYEAEYQSKRNKARQRYLQRYNKVKRNRDNDSKQRYQFYRSRQWASLRAAVLERDYYLCQYCLAIGHTTPNSRTVDHIVPIEYDDTLKDDINNLAVTCRKCHKEKTDWEQKFYGTGQKNQLKEKPEIKDVEQIVKLMNAK